MDRRHDASSGRATRREGTFVEWRVFDVATGKERAALRHGEAAAGARRAGSATTLARRVAIADELTFDAKKSAIVLSADGRSLSLLVRERHRHAPHVGAGGGRRADVQPRRQAGRLRPRQRSLRRRSRRPRAAAHDRRQRRASSTESSTRSTRKRSTAAASSRATGGAPTRRASPSCSSTSGRCREYTIVDHIPYRPDVKVYDYPKAGDPNPRVDAVRRARQRRRRIVEIDNEPLRGGEILIVDVDLERRNSAHVSGPEPRADLARSGQRVHAGRREHARSSARRRRPGSTSSAAREWLADGSFLWQSRAHRLPAHLSLQSRRHAGPPGHERRVGSARPARRRQAIRLLLRHGAQPHRSRRLSHQARRHRPEARLSSRPGTHSATFNPTLTHYVDKLERHPHARSDPRPSQRRQRRARRRSEPWRRSRLRPAARPSSCRSRRATASSMEAMMIKPPNFDPSKKYPVYQFLYGGPHAQQVRNEWAAGTQSMLFHAAPRAAGRHRLGVRQPHRQRQGRRLRAGRSTRTSASRSCATSRTARLAEVAAVRRRHPGLHQRLELRRLHGRVRADAQQVVLGRHRRRRR